MVLIITKTHLGLPSGPAASNSSHVAGRICCVCVLTGQTNPVWYECRCTLIIIIIHHGITLQIMNDILQFDCDSVWPCMMRCMLAAAQLPVIDHDQRQHCAKG